MELSKEELLLQLQQLRIENESLKSKLAPSSPSPVSSPSSSKYPLTQEEYTRYGRQMIVPQFGISSQLKVKSSKVLVIGAGGLGSPALLYLAGSGIGCIGVVDHDTVSVSNLHRQIIHSTKTVDSFKCESAKQQMLNINPSLIVNTYPEPISTLNAFEIIPEYDIVLDCTDNPATRYLINDVCVLCQKTIVSGSGLKTEGQLSILNYNNVGPCYRCFYPTPPPPSNVTSCSDGGVLGPCIGSVGVMMVTECIKVLSGWYEKAGGFKPFLSLYNGYAEIGQSLRTFKMRGRSKTCQICDEETRVITKDAILNGELNYSAWCGKVDYEVLAESERIGVKELKELVSGDGHLSGNVLLDVRSKEQFDIVKLPNSINVPYSKLSKLSATDGDSLLNVIPGYDSGKPLYVVCRFGNDSQLAVKFLKDEFGVQQVVDVNDSFSILSCCS